MAKSLSEISSRNHDSRRTVDHEVMSVALAQSNLDVLADTHDSDLVLHLVGTPSRACPTVAADPMRTRGRKCSGLTTMALVMEASTDLVDGPQALEMADRFLRLVERYGYHGLAWKEAILRLADQEQSAEQAKQ